MSPKICPICRLVELDLQPTGTGDSFKCKCMRCGTFTIDGTALHVLQPNTSHPNISAWIRDQNEFGKPPRISQPILDELLKSPPTKRVSEKQLLLLRAIERKSDFAGHPVILRPKFDHPLGWCVSPEEFYFVLNALQAQNLVSGPEVLPASRIQPFEVIITPKGWSLLEATAKPSALQNQVFVAMSFAPELQSAWTQGIYPAIKRAAYQPYRIDAQPHIDRIDAKIVSEIKNSRFLVADVTQQRPGVYFEAGYALGLGLPVFWCVREDDLENIHFDTRQYNHVVWRTESELAEKLHDFICAVVGKGSAADDNSHAEARHPRHR